MKRLITLALLLVALFHFNATAQEEYFKMLQDSTVWSYYYKSDSETCRYDNYIIDGDTMINGKKYYKLYSFSRDYRRNTPGLKRWTLREDGPKVYIQGKQKVDNYFLEYDEVNDETLLYDFSLGFGGKFGQFEDSSESIEVMDIKWIENYLPGDRRGRYRFELAGVDNDFVFGTWVEGIGSMGISPISPCFSHMPHRGQHFLSNFMQNGIMLEGDRGITLIKNGIRWVERETSKDVGDYELTNYLVEGDSIINGMAYKKVYANRMYHGAIRMNIERKVFYFKKDFEKEILLYDFDWRSCKEIHSQNYAGTDFVLVDKQEMIKPEEFSIKLHDDTTYYYRVMAQNPNPKGNPFRTLSKEVRLIKRLGLTSGMFSHVEIADPGKGYNDLVCLYEGDKLIYQNPDFKENGELASSIQSLTAERILMVTSKNGEVIFTLKEGMSTLKTQLYVYGIDGKLIATRSISAGTNTIGNMPKGVYYYRLEKTGGAPENGKFVVE